MTTQEMEVHTDNYTTWAKDKAYVSLRTWFQEPEMNQMNGRRAMSDKRNQQQHQHQHGNE